MKKFLKKIIFLSVFSLVFFCAGIAHAATISFQSEHSNLGIGQQFEVPVLLGSPSEDINAIEGLVTFPIDLVDLKDIRFGNSIVNFWVDTPTLASPGIIHFSGVTPGGFEGIGGPIFILVFTTKNEGLGAISLDAPQTLLNDGDGTAAPVTVKSFEFMISSATAVSPPLPISDSESPETFIPEITRDPNVFDNHWFLVFETQDKGVGMDDYEVKESRDTWFAHPAWITAQSPYLLTDQDLRSTLYVKAVDKAGNIRIATLPARNPLRPYEKYENWIIISLVLLLVLFGVWKFVWRKSKIS